MSSPIDSWNNSHTVPSIVTVERYPIQGIEVTTEDATKVFRSSPDPINHPPHYTQGKFECLDVIEDLDLPFHLGNVFKYLWRRGKKEGSAELQDCEKARFYLNRYIELLKAKAC